MYIIHVFEYEFSDRGLFNRKFILVGSLNMSYFNFTSKYLKCKGKLINILLSRKII